MAKITEVHSGRRPIHLSPDGRYGLLAEPFGSRPDGPSTFEPLLGASPVVTTVDRGAQLGGDWAWWHPSRPLLAVADASSKTVLIIDAEAGSSRRLVEPVGDPMAMPRDRFQGWLDDAVVVERDKTIVVVGLDGSSTLVAENVWNGNGICTPDGVVITWGPGTSLLHVGNDRAAKRVAIPELPKKMVGPYRNDRCYPIGEHAGRVLLSLRFADSRSAKPEPSLLWWLEPHTGELSPLLATDDSFHRIGLFAGVVPSIGSLVFTAAITENDESLTHLKRAPLDADGPVDVVSAPTLLSHETLFGHSFGRVPAGGSAEGSVLGLRINLDWKLYQIDEN